MHLQERPCPLCGSLDYQLERQANYLDRYELSHEDLRCTSLSHGKHFRILCCSNCSLQYCSPLVDSELLNKMYSELSDENYDYLEPGRIQTARKALKRISQPVGSSIVDIGCNQGIFLQVAKGMGYNVFGTEPNEKAREIASTGKGLKVTASLEQLSGDFDIATLWDVIEHLYEPLLLASEIFSRLKPGGEFHLSTMNTNSLIAKMLGSKWPWYMPMHIQYFSKDSIAALLTRAGFRDIKIFPYIHHPSVSYLCAKLITGARFPRLTSSLMNISRPTFPFYLGDMMHVIAKK